MIRTGSDFSGVGAWEEALKRIGVPYKTVFACDMDKYARRTYLTNHGTKEDFKLLDHHPDVKYCDDIYNRYADKKLKRPTISEYKKLLNIQEKTARLFSFYYPWNVKYRVDSTPTDIEVYSPPCQSFSLAGKRKGQLDARGVLFYNSHKRILKSKPRFFIFENVKGLLSDDKRNKKSKFGHTFQTWVDMLGGKSVNGNPVIFPREDAAPYHIYYKVLNAKHYGVPQNRERIFIVGIRDDADNNFTWPKPFPLKKRLKDVLEKESEFEGFEAFIAYMKKYFLTDKFLKYLNERSDNFNNGKINYKGENDISSCITKSSSSLDISDNIIKVGNTHPSGNGMNGNVFDADGISPTLSTNKGEGIKIKSATKKGYETATEGDSINLSQPNSETRRGRVGKEVAQTLDTACNQAVMMGAIRGRNPESPKSRVVGLPTEQRLELNMNGTSNALTTVQKDNVVVYGNLKGGKWDKRHEQSGRVYNPQGIGATIHTMGGGNQEPKIVQDYRIRRLTPRECFRLMDFGDHFIIDKVSNSQAYKQAGNSIAVKLLELLAKKLITQKHTTKNA